MDSKSRSNFTFRRSLSDIISACPQEDRGSLALAIISYGLDKTMPALSGKILELFFDARMELDRGWQLYRNGCSKPETHKNGGAPIGNKNAVKTDKVGQYQTKPDNTKQYQGKSEVAHLYKIKNIDNTIGDGEFDFVDDKLKDSFFRWLEYKRERKEQYKAMSSVKAAYNKLVKLSSGNPETAAMIVEQSIVASWKGLYELNGSKNTNAGMQTGVVLKENSVKKYDNQTIW